MRNYFKNLGEFFKPFGQYWIALMSGGSSVLLTGLSFYYPNEKVLFFCVGYFLLIFSAYHVWNVERKKVLILEDRLKPKLDLSFNPLDSTCITPVPHSKNQIATAFRLKVESKSFDRISGCNGKLISITRPFGLITNHQYIQLTFTPDYSPDTFSKIVHNGTPVYLDVVDVFQDNSIKIHTSEPLPNGEDWNTIFYDPGEYIFKISVTANQVVPVFCELKLLWNGDWKTAGMEKVN